jgi:hypothetical protein
MLDTMPGGKMFLAAGKCGMALAFLSNTMLAGRKRGILRRF